MTAFEAVPLIQPPALRGVSNLRQTSLDEVPAAIAPSVSSARGPGLQPKPSRRFSRIGMAAAGGGLLRYAPAQTKPVSGIKLGTMFTDRPNDDDLAMFSHAGVEAVSIRTSIENNSAEWMIGIRKKLEASEVEVTPLEE